MMPYIYYSDCLPLCGYHFRPWLAISSAGSACCYVLAGVYVESIGGAFLVTLVRSVCNACAEFMLGAVLVNEAREARGVRFPTCSRHPVALPETCLSGSSCEKALK